MNKLILSIIFVNMLSCNIALKSDNVRYVSKYNTNIDKTVINCVYTDENILLFKRDNLIIKEKNYKNKKDFIKELKTFGKTCLISELFNGSNYKDKCVFIYDNDKLVWEKAETMTIHWTKWDSKNRNIYGIFRFKEFNNNTISVSYDDKLYIVKFINNYSKALLDKYQNMPVEIVSKYDEYNNKKSTVYKQNDNKILEEIINVIEYKEIEI
jgi:hypothetical protein